MTTLIEAKQILLSTFTTDFAALQPTVPIFITGEKQKAPPKAPFVRITVVHATRSQTSLGGVGRRKFRSGGFVGVQVFAPLDAGSSLADNLAIDAQSVLEGKTLTSGGATVHTNSAPINEIGETPDGYQSNVSAAFYYHETK